MFLMFVSFSPPPAFGVNLLSCFLSLFLSLSPLLSSIGSVSTSKVSHNYRSICNPPQNPHAIYPAWRLSPHPLERASVDSVLEVAQVLVVAHDGLCTVLNQVAQEPQAQGRVAVLLDHVQLWVIRGPAHLPSLAHNQVHPLVKVALQCWESCLNKGIRKKKSAL